MRKRAAASIKTGNVTIKHIAEFLGISHSTVSRALHDHPYTNADTKHKVRKAVEKLGYVAHLGARTLRQDRSSLVGLILPDIQNELFATAAQTLTRYCLKAGLQLALAITEDDPDAEFKHVTALREARAAGIIITPTPAIFEKTVALLEHVPTVQYSRRNPSLAAPSVSVDGMHGLFLATSHLLQLGHRRIAYVGAEVNKSTGAERLAGFVKAHQKFNCRLDTGLQQLGPTHPDFGHAALSKLLQLPDPPTAAVLGFSALMPGVLRALRHAGIEVPSGLSLVGFGDPAWYAQWGPGITTLGIPLQELAEAAASQFMRQLQPENESNRAVGEHVALEPFFLLRGTTGPCATSRPKSRTAKGTVRRTQADLTP